jgi:hypothetical protein
MRFGTGTSPGSREAVPKPKLGALRYGGGLTGPTTTPSLYSPGPGTLSENRSQYRRIVYMLDVKNEGLTLFIPSWVWTLGSSKPISWIVPECHIFTLSQTRF